MHLDKDILVKGNKIYSPETCIFVPISINSLFTKRQNNKSDYFTGVSTDPRRNKYKAVCNDGHKILKHLGYFNTPEVAFNTYKQYKENLVNQIADTYKNQIPQKLYDAMYN